MSYKIEDIQTRINKRVADECQKEFENACKQCEEILRPFFDPMNNNGDYEERLKQAEFVTQYMFIDKYGRIYICSKILGEYIPAPPDYVRMRQNEESQAFIDKINDLIGRVDQIESEINI